MRRDPLSSTGLTTRQGALVAYAAGWITGLALLVLESRDHDMRWHAAQSVVGFGALTLLALAWLSLAAVGLLTSLTLFRVSLWGAQAVIAVGLGLWLWSLLQAARGRVPHWPFIGPRVDRLARP